MPTQTNNSWTPAVCLTIQFNSDTYSQRLSGSIGKSLSPTKLASALPKFRCQMQTQKIQAVMCATD